MNKIIIGFSKPKKFGIFAWAIMKLEGTLYSHVFIKWNWTNINRDIIYQASKLTVNFESNITFDHHAESLEEYEILITKEIHIKLMQFCMDNSNKPYGIKQIFGILCIKVCSLFGKKISNPFPNANYDYICSELAKNIIEIAQDIQIDIPSDEVTPLSLNNYIKQLNIKRVK